MNKSSNVNRWVPFQCPLCFGLFRLRRSQVGSAGHCPTCKSLIRVTDKPSEERTTPPVAEVESNESLLKKIEVAQPMTVEERVQQEEARQNRKRHYAGGGADDIDWEDGQERVRRSGPSWFLIGSGAMALLLILAGGLFYVKNLTPGESSKKTVVGGDAEAKKKLDEILDIDRDDSYLNEEGIDTTILEVDEYSNFDLMKAETTARNFLNSSTVTERSRFIREPERVRALMLKFYEGEDIEPEGFGNLDKTRVGYQGNLLTATAQTADFLDYPIAIERIGDGEKAVYQVDWESWVGYSDFSPEQMRLEKPTDPFEMRVIVSHGSYYNYGFSDDEEWACYRLSVSDTAYSFLGYAKRNSKADQRLMNVLKNQNSDHYLLKVRYPKKARSKDQLEIVEAISRGWVKSIDLEKSYE